MSKTTAMLHNQQTKFAIMLPILVGCTMTGSSIGFQLDAIPKPSILSIRQGVSLQPKTTSVASTRTKSDLDVESSSPIEDFWISLQQQLQSNKVIISNMNMNHSPGVAFVEAVADNNIDEALTWVDDNVSFFDTNYPSVFNRIQLERTLRLQAHQLQVNECNNNRIVIEDDVLDTTTHKAGVVFRKGNKKCATFFILDDNNAVIRHAFYVQENQKQGAINLQILKAASDILGFSTSKKGVPKASSNVNDSSSSSSSNNQKNIVFNLFSSLWKQELSLETSRSFSLPEQYFDAWNQRDMIRAASYFSTDIEYDDTAFPQPFVGKTALFNHLNVCAEALPEGFFFIVDDVIDSSSKVLVRWHVENDGKEMPFTKGCSFYEINQGQIIKGTDWKEPAVFKTGGLPLFLSCLIDNIKREPIRLVPLAVWVTYCYVVFFSDWFFGVPVQALETRTWEEVRDLSLNFFLVSPILGLPFSPVIHPGLEGIFNLLLSWAALFAGFLSDDRPKKPNPLPMLPMVVGMQLLTSAFLLPYIVTRSSETETSIKQEDLTEVSRFTERRLLGPAMCVVGTGSILWGFFARTSDFGGFSERFSSLLDLLSIDRVGSSFLVDLAIFGLFQGWLVDDDLKRRGVADRNSLLALAAKYIPFYGLAAYLTWRPSLTSASSSSIPVLTKSE